MLPNPLLFISICCSLICFVDDMLNSQQVLLTSVFAGFWRGAHSVALGERWVSPELLSSRLLLQT